MELEISAFVKASSIPKHMSLVLRGSNPGHLYRLLYLLIKCTTEAHSQSHVCSCRFFTQYFGKKHNFLTNVNIESTATLVSMSILFFSKTLFPIVSLSSGFTKAGSKICRTREESYWEISHLHLFENDIINKRLVRIEFSTFPVVANISIECFEKVVLKSSNFKLTIWFCYDDVSFSISDNIRILSKCC